MSISVIMSVYNESLFINDSISSILNQNFKNFEFLIIDDASNDNTRAIIKKIMEVDKRIILYENKTRKGLTKNLNFLIQNSKFDVIARMDADDISHPDRLGAQYKFLERNPDYGFLGSAGFHIDSQGKIIKPIKWVLSENFLLKRKLKISNSFIHGSIMIKKHLLEKVELYDEGMTYAQDYDLWLRMMKLCKISNLKKNFFSVRIHDKTISSLNSEKQFLFAGAAKYKNKFSINKISIIETENIKALDYKKIKQEIVLNAGYLALFQKNFVMARLFFRKLKSKKYILYNLVLGILTK